MLRRIRQQERLAGAAVFGLLAAAGLVAAWWLCGGGR
jgi:hypothetical protein